MPVNDWEDSWYDDPAPRRRNQSLPSGVVVVAVFSFVTCVFNALSASCLLFCGVLLAGHGMRMPGKILDPTVILVVTGIGGAVSFVGQIVAGIGLINLRKWAWTSSLFLAGYAVLICAFIVFETLTDFNLGALDESQVMQLVGMGIAFLFYGVYAALTFWILLNGKTARLFR